MDWNLTPCFHRSSCIIMHTFIKKFSSNIEGLGQAFFVNIIGMDFARRNTRKYSFKIPDLLNLRKLRSLVTSSEDFQARHGHFLSILEINVEEGILNTLVKFYDLLYHCFTFPDYQLVPTLEKYSYWVGLPVSDKVPFSDLEKTPKPSTIVAAFHLETSEIKANLTTKGGLQGLPSKFLFKKASTFAEVASSEAFESILSLLIYGLVLFPDFVDIIQIFLTNNPVPTFLADTHHSIHHRNQKGRRTILWCAPLLYKWFTSHLPQSHSFKANPENLLWSLRIMSLTPADIVWYNPTYDIGVIIDKCGEFPNVPLLGIRGGISYNPTLARRQFGYPMKNKPWNLSLAGEFYLNQEDSSGRREKFEQAWRAIHRKDRNQLGKKSDIIHESYT